MRDVARLVAALSALALLGYDFTLGGNADALLALAVPVALLVVVGLGLWSDGALTAGAGALLLHYVVALETAGEGVDLLVPAYAALLVLHVDAGDIAIGAPSRAPLHGPSARATAVRTCVRAAAAALVAALALGVAALPLPQGQPVRSVGIALAALALLAPVALVRRHRGVEPLENPRPPARSG